MKSTQIHTLGKLTNQAHNYLSKVSDVENLALELFPLSTEQKIYDKIIK